MSKEWSGGWCGPGGCCEEWSVHAHLTLSPQQAGNITVTTDSGYGSEKGSCTPARATCSVTLAGHHTVTLTCAEVPPVPVPPQPKEKWVFCNHHDKQQRFATPSSQPPASASSQPPPAPVYKDVASQTSTSHLPQVLSSQQQQDSRGKAKMVRKSPAKTRKIPKEGRNENQNKYTTTSSSDGKKTPRTVHIDVYCTGSESNGSSSSDEETASTPQTVFESGKVKVIHSRANSDTLPHALQRQKRCVLSNPSVPTLGSGSISSGYPSAQSSMISATDGMSLTSGSVLSSAAVTSAKDTDFSSRDSFDYENSFDRLRIKEKERLWANKLTHGTMTEESSESSSDSEGMAWSFDRVLLKREDTVKRTSEDPNKPSTSKIELSKSGSLSDSETSLKYKREALTKKPCPVFQHFSKASKFGPIVSTLKKPGHHVGPSKNPNCSCDTCRYFFEHVCYRNRTRSLGDKPLEL
ncbi:uncharacterized protein [Halyomorpha halys]|uniref:uncharacterized protein n=1 Tax=Halyomorpha halys TaxID=286706 RepID=UPI000D0C8FD7|nr:suppressor protein SRP40 [Halyomorpha halys]